MSRKNSVPCRSTFCTLCRFTRPTARRGIWTDQLATGLFGMILLPCRKRLTTQSLEVHPRIKCPTLHWATNYFNSPQRIKLGLCLTFGRKFLALFTFAKVVSHRTQLFSSSKCWRYLPSHSSFSLFFGSAVDHASGSIIGGSPIPVFSRSPSDSIKISSNLLVHFLVLEGSSK